MTIEYDTTFFKRNPTKGGKYPAPTASGRVALHLQTFLYQADWLDELANTLCNNPTLFDPDDEKFARDFERSYRATYRAIGELYDELIEWHGVENLANDPQINAEARQRAQILLDQHRRYLGLPTWDYPEGKPGRSYRGPSAPQ